MKTEKELNADILKMTMLIQEKFPELSKYIPEMQAKTQVVTDPEVNKKDLQEYYIELEAMLKKYNESHVPQ